MKDVAAVMPLFVGPPGILKPVQIIFVCLLRTLLGLLLPLRRQGLACLGVNGNVGVFHGFIHQDYKKCAAGEAQQQCRKQQWLHPIPARPFDSCLGRSQ